MAAKRFAAPSSYDRSVYNDPSAMPRYKEQVFQQGAKVTSTATGQTLVRTQAEAKAIYGDEWTLHSMETDHIVPVKQVHEQLKDNPFLTNEDRREIANIQENFQPLGRSDNASKRDQSNEQFIQNPNSQGKITRRGAENLRRSQQKAHAAINSKVLRRTAYRVGETFHNAGTQAAQYGGVSALTASGITNIIAVIKGEKSPGDALSDIARDGVKGAASSYVAGGGLTTLAQAFSRSSSKIIQSFMKSNVPGQIVTGVMAFGGALKRYATGEIDTREFVLEIGEGGLNFGAMSYGFAVGQSLIPIPIIGGIIGSLVGSALTSGLIGRITENLRRKELEHLERMRLTAELEEAARQERAFRAELESYLREWFRDYRECFTEALSGMESAFAAGANAITRKLGGTVQFETVAEYRRHLANNVPFEW
ncbi:MAG: hypothetical protein IKQ95_03015 [Synergistaceae bacterium]|nr:hypothetical protein [Synergistaceae bacterium]